MNKFLRRILFSKTKYGRYSVQPHTSFINEAEYFTKGQISFAAGIVLVVNYPDEVSNISAVRNVVTLSAMDSNRQIYKDFIQDKDVLSRVIGHQVECEVAVYHYLPGRLMTFIIKNVPVLQRGGLSDIDLWTPKGTTNWDGSNLDKIRLFNLDGDHVLIGFLGNIFPHGAVILGSLPHPLNKEDVPRNIYGTFGTPKKYGDRTRKDGKIAFSSQNGAVVKTDQHGNIIVDTVQADRSVDTDLETGEVKVTQSIIPWTQAGDTAPVGDEEPSGDPLPFNGGDRRSKEIENPGGGDLDLRVKNNRKVKLSFFDNTVAPLKEENPPLFKETGFIQITNEGENRIIDVCLSDSLQVRIRKFGSDEANAKVTIDNNLEVNVGDNCKVNVGNDCEIIAGNNAKLKADSNFEIEAGSNGKIKTGDNCTVEVGDSCNVTVEKVCTIHANDSFSVDTSTAVAAIILGSDVEQLATKKFVEQVFCQHIHSGVAPGASSTSNPIVSGKNLSGATVNPITGTLDIALFPVVFDKIATTKTKAE